MPTPTTDQLIAEDSYTIGSLWACGGGGVFIEALGLGDCDAELETIRAPLYASITSAADTIASLFVGAAEATVEGAGSGLASPPGGDYSASTIVAYVGLGALAGWGVAAALDERPLSGALWGGGVGLAWGLFGVARSVLG